MKPETTSSPNLTQTIPFLWVLNIEDSVRYYVEGLGFKTTRRWMNEGKLRWCLLERGGAALMLQEFRREGQHGPEGKLGVGVSIYFICEDALAMYLEITSREIQASKPSVGNGMWFTSLMDPNGYHIVFESYTDVPEDTEYSS